MIEIYIMTLFKGIKAGEDEQGNKYYYERFFFGKPKDRKPRRWVIYKGIPEASKVPANWHSWIHYSSEDPPADNKLKHSWQKKHLPNLTGTTCSCNCKNKENQPKHYKPWVPK